RTRAGRSHAEGSGTWRRARQIDREPRRLGERPAGAAIGQTRRYSGGDPRHPCSEGRLSVAAFPSYDAKLLEALEGQSDAVLATFARAAYARVEPPILQPADVFLDRSGEEIRRRTFVLTDPAGRELCLRPDLTIPVCRMHLEGRGKFPARLAYHGPAFR